LMYCCMACYEFEAGHTLLERYGMTETGMVLSNPYRGERTAGSIGYPLQSIQVRIRPEEGGDDACGPGAQIALVPPVRKYESV
jgi:malonyl-CoA/methylmalonyl-CoA synthetase